MPRQGRAFFTLCRVDYQSGYWQTSMKFSPGGKVLPLILPTMLILMSLPRMTLTRVSEAAGHLS